MSLFSYEGVVLMNNYQVAEGFSQFQVSLAVHAITKGK